MTAKVDPGAGDAARGADALCPDGYSANHSLPASGAQAPTVAVVTEDVLALEFAARHEGRLRYVNATSPKKWFVLAEDGIWVPDTTLMVLDMVRSVCREAAAQCTDPVISREIASAWSIFAVERLARSDRRLAASHEDVGVERKKRTRRARS